MKNGLLAAALSWVEILIFVLFAAVGGCLGYLMRTSGRKEQATIARTVLEGLSAGFLGIVTLLVCRASGLDWIWSGVIVGIFSWLGAEATVMAVIRFVKRKLGIDLDPKSTGGE
ncbi:holin [Klebsiella phage VLCpiS6a]|jgi:hypothetical protein|nr:holin [Klebsiella phage VLCpiS6a]CAK6596370.1 holin [Klebsiella phage vB_Kpn_K21lambda1]DAU75779.1 MAG TPA: LydA holin phage, holin superfamily III [Caudoviricetes sp.]